MNQQPELIQARPILRQGRPDIRPLRDFSMATTGEKSQPPEAFIVQVERSAAQAENPDAARQALDAYLPDLGLFRPNGRLWVSLGLLTEKLRQQSGMLAFWSDLNRMFPQNETALRLMMRWYRRTRQFEEGRQRLCQLCPAFTDNGDEAQRKALGYQELRAFSELDAMMATAAQSDRLDVIYVEALVEQQRFAEALERRDMLRDPQILHPAIRQKLDGAKTDNAKLHQYDIQDAFDVLGKMVDAYADMPPERLTKDGETGTIAFFTGQLGMGGAERQMTRLAAQLQKLHEAGVVIGGQRITRPPLVCVRHATHASQSDFFLPVLQQGRVSTTVLSDVSDPGVGLLSSAPAVVRDLFYQLPEDIQQNTCKLVRYFQDHEVDVAYLWQDGGVLTSALAALIARVPRIVGTFRGMPPNCRPELFRPQMTALNIALSRLPWVTLTTNSKRTARAYEDWLGLADGQIKVIYNAVEPLAPDGDAQDEMHWADMLRASPDCTRTVLGVFRFDHNKRPARWIEAAAAYLHSRPATRFIMIGAGHEWQNCQEQIVQSGLQDRIFLLGTSTHVGFYMHRADVLMHLARFEGLPNSLIEAAFCGLPAITTPAGGAAEVVQHDRTGLVLDDANTVDIAAVHLALDRLLNDQATLDRLSTNAISRARDLFDMSRVLQKTLHLFN